jgi:uncharacterized protein YcbX
MIKLTEINIYPVKSMAGITLQSSAIDAMGLQYDRRWMVVSPTGKFITQRSHPQMALIQPHLNGGQLTLSSFGLDDHIVPLADANSPRKTVQVWNDTVQAQHLSAETDHWLAHTLGEPCHLVYIDAQEVRQCDLSYAKQGDRTGFSDGFPLLLISQASLDDLNAKLNETVTMQRFRPNLVVSGCEAFAEDTWQSMQINTLSFHIVKPCSRCIITTVNPQLGFVNSPEPLQTLATYRKVDNKIYFGQNVIHQQTGHIHLGEGILIKNDVSKKLI